MEARGWDQLDVLLITGDAYIDHPSFGIPLLGRYLERLGYRVGILAQPDWRKRESFLVMGRPRLYVGISAGAMDSMVSNYTVNKKFRYVDAYSPHGKGGLRPNRASLVYANRIRETMPGVPIVLGGVEASMRRFAHYDFWEDRLRRSFVLDARADIVVYGNGELQLAEITRKLAQGLPVASLWGIPGTAVEAGADYLPQLIDAGREYVNVACEGPEDVLPVPRRARSAGSSGEPGTNGAAGGAPRPAGLPVALERFGDAAGRRADFGHTPLAGAPELPRRVMELFSFERLSELDCSGDKAPFVDMAEAIEAESSPYNGKLLYQRHGDRVVMVYPPVRILTTREFDDLYTLPFTKEAHPAYGGAPIPAYEMIKFSITTQRGCFGGCTFCAITAHQGRIVQSRSEESILGEIEALKEVPGFTGVVSDLGGPTANMYRMSCSRPEIETICRRSSCVWPTVCKLLDTDHTPQIDLMRKARSLPGIKKVFIASGVRYDLAIIHPEFIRELAEHHVGGHLKVAPEHSSDEVLRRMKKPPIAVFDEFKRIFDRYSKEAGKEQYLVPYFISSFPSSKESDMAGVMRYLEKNRMRLEQVQDFLPTPMTIASAMYYAGMDGEGESIFTARTCGEREVQKAYLRYHDPKMKKVLRERGEKPGRRPHRTSAEESPRTISFEETHLGGPRSGG
jgi:uncharacterized radical SAM protein YgiQ